ncbi:hypothetical protein B0H14DRAFT_485120 [Mycena olivaceomarginata]|nr:hypothetical protein B0H14DRAFT_485120 [Mycena olivaceomarginata]
MRSVRPRYNVRRFYLFVDPPTYDRRCQFLLHPATSGVLDLTRVPPQSSCPASSSLSAAHSLYIHRQNTALHRQQGPSPPPPPLPPHSQAYFLRPRPRTPTPTLPGTVGTNRPPHPHPKRVFCVATHPHPPSHAPWRSLSPYRYAHIHPDVHAARTVGDDEVRLVSARVCLRVHEARAGREGEAEGKRRSVAFRGLCFPLPPLHPSRTPCRHPAPRRRPVGCTV